MGFSLGRIGAAVATGGISEAVRAVGKAAGGGGGGDGGGGPSNNIPEVDPRLKALAAEQDKAAADFRAKLPEYKEQQYNMASDKMKRSLAGDLAGVDQAANRRGLLYSGIRGAGQAQAQANLAGGLAETKANINQSAEDQAKSMELQGIQTGMGVASAEQNRNNLLYQQAMNKYMQKKQMAGGVGGLLGTIGGAFLGGPAGAMAGGQAGSAVGGGLY